MDVDVGLDLDISPVDEDLIREYLSKELQSVVTYCYSRAYSCPAYVQPMKLLIVIINAVNGS